MDRVNLNRHGLGEPGEVRLRDLIRGIQGLGDHGALGGREYMIRTGFKVDGDSRLRVGNLLTGEGHRRRSRRAQRKGEHKSSEHDQPVCCVILPTCLRPVCLALDYWQVTNRKAPQRAQARNRLARRQRAR